MAYPPALPPDDRSDSTLAATRHPQDHNTIAVALRELVAELGANPSGGYADVTTRLGTATPDPETFVPAPVGTNDTTSLSSAVARGGHQQTRTGIYATDPLTITVAGTHLDIVQGSVVKLRNNVLAGTPGNYFATRVAASGVKVTGKIDGNRAGQDKAAFNTAGGSATIYSQGIWVYGLAGAEVNDVDLDVTVVNVADSPVTLNNVKRGRIKVLAQNCGGSVQLSDCEDIEIDVIVEGSDNDGWKIFPHAVDLSRCKRITGRIIIRGQASTTAAASLSAWFSGLTMIDCEDVHFDTVVVEASDAPGMSISVGVSILGCRNWSMGTLRVAGYSDVLLELGGDVNWTITNIDLDGKYALGSTAGTQGLGRGIALYNNGYRGDLLGQTKEFTRNGKILGGKVRRCLNDACDLLSAADIDFVGVDFVGSKYGFRMFLTEPSPTSKPAPGPTGGITGIRLIDCGFIANEKSGFLASEGSMVTLIAPRSRKNGQASTFGSVRNSTYDAGLDSAPSGIAFRDLTPKYGVEIVVPDCDDDQNFTAPGFVDPNDPTWVAIDRPEHYDPGQTITITGAGAAGADLLTRINSVTRDRIKIDTPIVTFPTVAGTGTITTTGTAIVGSGTAFLTQLTGRAYIKVGANIRRILKVADNTHATLETAFTADVAAGTSFTIHQATIHGMPSQVYGLDFGTDVISPLIVGGKAATGNTTALVRDQTLGATCARFLGTPKVRSAVVDASRASYRSGWYIAPNSNAGTKVATEALVDLTPFWIGESCTLDRLLAEVTSAGSAGSVIRLGIYGADKRGLPGTLILDAGTVVATSIARVAATISQALDPGLYYFAVAVQGAATTPPTMRVSLTSGQQQVASTDGAVTNLYCGYSQSGVTGAFPSTLNSYGASGNPLRATARFV